MDWTVDTILGAKTTDKIVVIIERGPASVYISESLSWDEVYDWINQTALVLDASKATFVVREGIEDASSDLY